MFDYYLVRKQALLDYEKADFREWPYQIFFCTKGLNYDFGPKLEITPWFGFEQSKPENNVWLLSI